MSQNKTEEDLYRATSHDALGEYYTGEPIKITEDCAWHDLFNHDVRDYIKDICTIFGIASTLTMFLLILNKWKLNLGRLVPRDTYNYFYKYIYAMFFRSFIPLLIGFLKSYGLWYMSCDATAFLESFFVVYEMETLTHVCIERYVVAKYITNGWDIRKSHYKLYSILCIFFALLYTVPAYVLWSGYDKDFTCSKCDYALFLPRNCVYKFFAVASFFLRSVKPFTFMITTLTWAEDLEFDFTPEMKTKSYDKFTDMVLSLVLLNLFCWLPLAMAKAWVIFSQIVYKWVILPDHFGEMVYCALLLYELSPALCSFVIFLKDGRVFARDANLINVVNDRPHED